MDEFLDKYIFPYTGKYFGRTKTTKDGFPIYTEKEEIFNTASHAIGIFLGIAVIIESIMKAHSIHGTIGGLIFGISMVILYLSSSIYHGTPVTDVPEKKVFHLMDYCSISILVAGTCSPFIIDMIAETSDNSEWLFYAVIWFLAIGNIALLFIDMKKYKSIAIVIYVLMGYLLVTRSDMFMKTIGEDGTIYLIAGGATYLLGLLFFGLGSKRRWMHSVFHVLCLIASALHAVCIIGYVI